MEKMRAAQALKIKYPDLYEKVAPFYKNLSLQQVQRILYNGTKGYDTVVAEVKKANPVKNTKLGSAKVPVNTAPINPSYDPEEVAKKLASLDQGSVEVPIGSKATGVGALNQAKLELAQEYMKNRTPGPMYSNKDWEAYNTIREYGNANETRWYRSPEYNEFDSNVAKYNSKIKEYARNKYGINSMDYDRFVEDNLIERGHINAKGNRGFSHLRDVDCNMSIEFMKSNRPKKASMTLAEWVNGMEVGSGTPMARKDELKSIERMIQTLSNEGLDVSGLRGNLNYFNKLPKYEEVLGELDKSFNLPMFSGTGTFLPLNAMPEGTTPEEYERLRRLFITMADANPDFDLDAYIAENKLPSEFRNGIPMDGKPAASLETVRRGNRQVGQQYLATKADAAEGFLSTKQKKTTAGLLTFLSSIGAPFAKMLPFAGVPFAAEEAVNSWNEGNYVRSGINAVDAATLGLTPLGFVDAGFEVAEQNGSMQSNIDAARAESGVTSADDVARKRWGQLRNIWTNDD